MPVSCTLILLMDEAVVFHGDGIERLCRLNPVILNAFHFLSSQGIVCRNPFNNSF